MITEKKCTSCTTREGKDIILPIESFGTRKNNPDGYADQCKKCINTYQKTNSDKKKALKLSAEEARVIENQLNGLHKIADVISTPAEEAEVDETLLSLIKPFYYFLMGLRSSDEGYLYLPSQPHAFVQTFFPNSTHAGLELFHIYVNIDEGGYKWKTTLPKIHDLAQRYSTLVSLSSLVREPSTHIIARDINDIREMMQKMKSDLSSVIEGLT